MICAHTNHKERKRMGRTSIDMRRAWGAWVFVWIVGRKLEGRICGDPIGGAVWIQTKYALALVPLEEVFLHA